MPFQKGQSGNPNGRPRSGHAFSEMLRRRLTKKAQQAIADKAIAMAQAGDLRAMEFIADRTEGRPAQAITGRGGGPLHFTLDIRKPDDEGD